MRNTILVIIIMLGITAPAISQTTPEITASDLMRHITVLASDSLEGRAPGTPGGEKAEDYIAKAFANAGLTLLFDNGLQHFDLVTSVEATENCVMKTGNENLVIEKDFSPALFSGNGELSAKVSFCGYGFQIDEEELKWNDFDNADVEENWALILRGDPETDSVMSAFIPYSGDRTKVFNAIDRGAKGVLLVTTTALEKEDKLPKQYFDRSGAGSSVPVMYITRKTADKLLAGTTVSELENELNATRKPVNEKLSIVVTATTELRKEVSKTANVVGLLPGTNPELNDQYILVGAHYDHLGYGGPGSGSRVPDISAIHNGADDNASGVAGVIELAEYFASAKAPHPRPIIFAAFGAEESGLVGSKFLAKNMPVPIENLKAMFNFDMIGRYNKEKGKISIGGTGTSLEGDSLIDIAGKAYDFGITKSSDGYGPSDHASFYSAGVPVFFISTGAHSDYHTPNDDTEFIDAQGAEAVASFSADLLALVSQLDEPLTYQRTASQSQGRRGMRLKVTFGIMPDMVGQENNGLGVDGVRPGGPADKAGMKNGDRIIAINGEEVTNIYNYMHRLGKLKPGETAVVEVIRDGKSEILLIQL